MFVLCVSYILKFVLGRTRSCALLGYSLNAVCVVRWCIFRQLQLIIDDQRPVCTALRKVVGLDINMHVCA